VLIGELTHTLSLPIDAIPGDELQLTVIDRDPPRGPATAPQRTPGPGAATVTMLSETARFITTLLNTDAPSPVQPPAAGVSRAAAPLLPGPPGNTTAVAARLSEALATSGMFYESHQAQWVAGERSLAQLMQEPQAHVPPLLPESVYRDTAGGDRTAAAPVPATAETPVHPALLTMVKEQLQTLSALQLAWQGAVWPGQEMRWEIAEEPGRDGASKTSSTWQTRIELRLPRLGEVRATVSVSAAGAGITLAAKAGATADIMSAASAALYSALNAAGLRPASFRIERGLVDHG
jgi:hypothetical protein